MAGLRREQSRVLKWIVERLEGKAEGVETPTWHPADPARPFRHRRPGPARGRPDSATVDKDVWREREAALVPAHLRDLRGAHPEGAGDEYRALVERLGWDPAATPETRGGLPETSPRPVGSRRPTTTHPALEPPSRPRGPAHVRCGRRREVTGWWRPVRAASWPRGPGPSGVPTRESLASRGVCVHAPAARIAAAVSAREAATTRARPARAWPCGALRGERPGPRAGGARREPGDPPGDQLAGLRRRRAQSVFLRAGAECPASWMSSLRGAVRVGVPVVVGQLRTDLVRIVRTWDGLVALSILLDSILKLCPGSVPVGPGQCWL